MTPAMPTAVPPQAQPAPRGFLSDAIWNVALLGFSWVFGVLSAVLVGRWLGPAGKGEYTLATLVGALLLTVLNLGIPQSISYYLGGNRIPQGSLVKLVLALAAGLSTAGILIALLLDRTGWCRQVFGVARFSAPIWAAVVMLPLQFAGNFLQFVVLGQGRRVTFAVLPAIGQGLVFLLLLALILAGRLSPFTAVGTLVVSQIFTTAALLIHQQRATGWLHSPWPRREGLHLLARYSLLTHAANTLQFLLQRIDVLFVSVLLGMRDVGLYSVAYGLAELLLLVPQRLGVLYLPRVAGQSSPAQKSEEIRLSTSVVFAGTLVAAATVAAVGPIAIRLLYGNAFGGSVAPLFLLLPGVCALAINNILGAYLAGVGRIEINLVVAAIGLACNLLLNWILIPRYGIAGAAVSSSLCYLGQAFLLLSAVARLTGNARLSLLASASPHIVAGALRRAIRGT